MRLYVIKWLHFYTDLLFFAITDVLVRSFRRLPLDKLKSGVSNFVINLSMQIEFPHLCV